MRPNWDLTATDYKEHRSVYPPALFSLLRERGVVRDGDRVLDLGTGTGAFARGIAGLGGQVLGVDIAGDLLEVARASEEAHPAGIEYLARPAESTRLPDATFDVVTAAQCWHWFDRRNAAREAHRVLVDGGILAIVHFDWLPLEDNVVARTEQLILHYNPRWSMSGGTGIYPAWYSDVASGGFGDIQSCTFDQSVSFTHDGWRGRIRASAGIGASLAPDDIERFDAELMALLSEHFPQDPMDVPHRAFILWAHKMPSFEDR